MDSELKSLQKRPFIQKGSYNKEVVEQEDRISDLPDHVIAQILSFLETEEAVKTSVLSSRWRYLWKGITCISLRGANADPDKFSNLVEHVLQNCSSTNFQAFDLACPSAIDLSRLNAWIGCVLNHKLEKLQLWINKYFYELPERPLAQFILSCNTLVTLKLKSCFDIHIPESVVCFPFLKLLDIDVIFPDHIDVVNQLLSCCPVLEELDLLGYLDSPKVLKIDVSSSTLRKLNLGLKYEGGSCGNEFTITLNTPNLERLSIEDDSLSRYVLKNLVRVYTVEVNYCAFSLTILGPEHINRLLELLKGVAAAENLILKWNTLGALGSTLRYTWPTFPNLKTLIMHLSPFSGWTCFSKVLHSAPCLEVLILDLEDINDEIYQWSPPDIVPNCLLEHLKEIGILCFEGNEDELQVVEYLLNNAQVLEFMWIGFGLNDMNVEVLQKLLAFTRASKTCDVQINKRLTYEVDSLDRISIWGV
ncbi:F-box/FBD/LRR-repeat protein At2g26030-like [Chenopodium quinoa]|uniref:F-box/FBD/LRR-repeat protein At2g26030-like n=1 Tax=Chenopodium quinoa TaxID=63459 RepID=UPI000B776966|nr:F-box/FBD/LRR-repeat protein At2g26030-like [Chenopodium quinoa]